MLIGFLGISFLVGGCASLLISLNSIRSGSNVDLAILLRSAIFILWILLGVGLLRRYRWSWIVASGHFLLGSFTFLFLPILFFISGGRKLPEALLIISVAIGRFEQAVQSLQYLPMMAALVILVLVTLSAISYLIYRLLQRADYVNAFWRGNGEDDDKSNAQNTRGTIYLAAAFLGGLFLSPVISQAFQEKTIAEEKELEREQHADRMLVKQISISQDGNSVYISSADSRPKVISIDVDHSTVIFRDTAKFLMHGEVNQNSLVDRLSSLLSANHLHFFSRTEKGAFINTVNDEIRPISRMNRGNEVALGFTQKEKFFLFYRPIYLNGGSNEMLGATIEMVNVESGATLYETPATRPERQFTEDAVNKLPHAINKGIFSPNQKRYAFLYKGELHVLNTESGEISFYGHDLDDASNMHFSAESDAVLLTPRESSNLKEYSNLQSDVSKGVLVRFEDGNTTRHRLTGRILYFSTSADLIVYTNGEVTEAISYINFPNLKWRIEAQPGIGIINMSADGKFLFSLKSHPQSQYLFVDLRKVEAGIMPAWQPVNLTSNVPADTRFSILADRTYMIFHSSPYLEILRTDVAEDRPETVFATKLSSGVQIRH